MKWMSMRWLDMHLPKLMSMRLSLFQRSIMWFVICEMLRCCWAWPASYYIPLIPRTFSHFIRSLMARVTEVVIQYFSIAVVSDRSRRLPLSCWRSRKDNHVKQDMRPSRYAAWAPYMWRILWPMLSLMPQLQPIWRTTFTFFFYLQFIACNFEAETAMTKWALSEYAFANSVLTQHVCACHMLILINAERKCNWMHTITLYYVSGYRTLPFWLTCVLVEAWWEK